MSDEYINRFALILLRNNGHLGRFEVDVMDRDFAVPLRKKLNEIGCEASLSDHGSGLIVICPEQVLERVLQEPDVVSGQLL
jgi:hypothetical protein